MPASIEPQSRAWYGASVAAFINSAPDEVIGRLAQNTDFDLVSNQTAAWLEQINILQKQLLGIDGRLFFEFNIPRMGRRIDVVLLTQNTIFVIEFKTGETSIGRGDIEQVWDYALDLKNFHQGSHDAAIVPLLVASNDRTRGYSVKLQSSDDLVYLPCVINPGAINEFIQMSVRTVSGKSRVQEDWDCAPYCPTPTIIEAARSLYASHSVAAIARFDAGAKNLSVTFNRLEEIIEESRRLRRKSICFVTGVPGAGKTLVGLNVATRHSDSIDKLHSVFLSGNGPLVAVLREALTRDEVARRRVEGKRVRKSEVAEKVKAFIQNVHHFRDDALKSINPPVEHVVIFDEAQRAWNLKQTAGFMQRKKKVSSFSQSEPEFLISCMERHADWAVIVCLVGGGQEINRGEAGIGAWLGAICTRFPHWHTYVSSRLPDAEYGAKELLEKMVVSKRTYFDEKMHLSVSLRSFRAEHVSSFVKALLDCDESKAKDLYGNFSTRYPMAVTRNLSLAKTWVKQHARGSERFGMVASSKAQRLKPHAIDVRNVVDPVHWFLNEREHTRSSYYLEDAATEFQVQGLEIDWVCVTWDGDMRFDGEGWTFHDFRGDRWCNIKNEDNRRYTMNAYRVLLTRARQGMVIFVPEGDPDDPTRSPDYYDRTFAYLAELGLPLLA